MNKLIFTFRSTPKPYKRIEQAFSLSKCPFLQVHLQIGFHSKGYAKLKPEVMWPEIVSIKVDCT